MNKVSKVTNEIRRKVMKNAHFNIKHKKCATFSEALKKAWIWVKETFLIVEIRTFANEYKKLERSCQTAGMNFRRNVYYQNKLKALEKEFNN